MNLDLILSKKYSSYKVYSTTRIKCKYGFRIKLIYDDEKEIVTQRSGYNTKKECESAREDIIAELVNGTFVVYDSIRIKDFFIYWFERCVKNKISSNTYDSYKNIIYNYIIPKMGDKFIIKVTEKNISNLYKEISEKSHSVTKLAKVVINIALDYAKSKNLVKYNVARKVALPKNIKKSRYRERVINKEKTLTIEQLKLLIEKSKDTPIFLYVLFAGLMGLRKGETLGLKYENVDFIHQTLQIKTQLGKLPNSKERGIKPGQITKQDIKLKTFNSDRILNIPDLVFEAILEERKKYEANRRRRINDKSNPFKDLGYICCSTYGNPRSKSFHFKYWKKLLKDCGLPNIRFHDLRATYCTLLIENEFSGKAVSTLMGHKTEIITIDVYTNKRQIIGEGYIEKISNFMESVLPSKNDLMIDYSNDENYIKAINTFIDELNVINEL